MTNAANAKVINMPKSALSVAEIDARIVFHEDSQVLEISFADLTLSNSQEVNHFFDRIQERIAETGEPLWFFLTNHYETRVDTGAWFAFSRRGMDLKQAHSMASVRYDASEMTRKQIERDAGTEAFDPNVFVDRERALERLLALPSKRREKIVMMPSFNRKDWNWRLEFQPDEQILQIDFSGFSFEHSRDVNDVYDFIESQIRPTGRKWYFLINYDGTRIQSPAWIQYSIRGTQLNEDFSLGSARYAPDSETETDIRLRAQSQGTRPNIRNTYEEAYQLITELKADSVPRT